MENETIIGFDGCEYCDSHCPTEGYWRCPVCDAEWHDDEEEPEDGK